MTIIVTKQQNKGFTFLELVIVLSIIGVLISMSGISAYNDFRYRRYAEQTYNEMLAIALYYNQRQSCSTTIPSGYKNRNPVNNNTYNISCNNRGITISTVVDNNIRKYLSSKPMIYISGNTIYLVHTFKIIGDGGYDKKVLYNQ